jgi:hypothetical protein
MRFSSALATLVASAIMLGSNLAANADPPKGKEIRRDENNRKGISPYMELLIKGDAAFVARDLPGAISTYQEAAKLRPEEMMALYRLGEAQQESGHLDDAGSTWEAALSKVCNIGCEGRPKDDLKGKLMFNIAGLREREQKWAAAKDAWQSYAAFLQGNPKVHGYPATAADRIKQIDRRVQLEADYGKVKERIARRIAEKEKEAEENAKKDKLNK